MNSETAIPAFAALAQSTRLEALRLMVRHEPEGLAAGRIADLLAIPANTMSAHLAVLARSGLIVAERRSRSIIYRADLERLRDLASFLLEDCCQGRADACKPLSVDLAPC